MQSNAVKSNTASRIKKKYTLQTHHNATTFEIICPNKITADLDIKIYIIWKSPQKPPYHNRIEFWKPGCPSRNGY